MIMSLPGIVLLIALYALTGPNIPAAMAVFGVIIAPTYYRLVRSIVLGVRNELYVDAARVVGLSDLRIVGRHVLWAVRAPVIIQSSFVMAAAIGIEAGVSFLGLGDPAGASWGIVLQTAFNGIYNNAWAVLWPALVISLTILALVLLGNALSDVLQSSARSKVLSARRAAGVGGVRGARAEGRAGHHADPGAVLRTTSCSPSADLRIGYPTADGGVTEVVHGVDLDVRRGEIHGLVGESGSGKSQIAFSTLGILPREALVLSGSVLLDGEDLLADSRRMQAARGRRIGYIPQEPMSNLDPSFTIGAQLVYGLRAARPMPKAEARQPAHRAARPGRHHRPRTGDAAVPARDLRRHGPAGPDLRSDRLRPGPHRRRRADHGPRRHRPGRGAGAAARAQRGAGAGDDPGHPQPRGRRRPLRHRQRDEGRAHRRARRRRRRSSPRPSRRTPSELLSSSRRVELMEI